MTSREPRTRRRVLRLSGTLLAGTTLAGCSSVLKDDGGGTTTVKERADPGQLSLRKLGQTYPSGGSPPSGGYSDADVRTDGRYAVVGTKWGVSGSYLIDLDDPNAPQQAHYLDNSDNAPNLDVKFDHRDGLYHRAIESGWPGNFEIVDYGYDSGTPKDPRVVGTASEGESHNVTPHPTKSILYSVNYELETNGFTVYDVADPTSPRELGQYGPQGACHHVEVDPKREMLCASFQSGQFVGIVIYDASDPRKPVELGRFDYRERKPYSQAEVGEEAFGSAHRSYFDPRRDLLVVGDERLSGNPGGKHVFDIGWKDGSPGNPVPIGFTVSPNARPMEDKLSNRLDWTGHHFDVVPWGDATLLLSADWKEGVVLYDITDPTKPRSIDRYPTDDGANEVPPNDTVTRLGKPPMAWKAAYNAEREFAVVSDVFTGFYTFELASRSG